MNVVQLKPGSPSPRIARLAEALQLLARRVREEPEAARSLTHILDDVAETRRAVDRRRAMVGGALLAELSVALKSVELAIGYVAALPETTAPSRAADRRAHQRAARLEASTAGLLRRVANVLTAASVSAALATQPVAAAVVIDAPAGDTAIYTGQGADTVLNVNASASMHPLSGGVVQLSGDGFGGTAALPQHYECVTVGTCIVTGPSFDMDGKPVAQTCWDASDSSKDDQCTKVEASGNPDSVGTGPFLTANVGTSSNTINITAPGQYGVVVNSTGGGGGHGSDEYIIGSGGSGGAGADGGTAVANAYANINVTDGPGVAAFSIGGLGGDGGGAYGLGGSGGSGGAAGFAGAAEAHLFAGNVTTHGAGSLGVAAVSQGGNGGRGGNSGGLFYSKGGGGTTAGAGESAKVTTASGLLVETFDRDSHGVTAQSVGGRGGGGGSSFSLVFSDTKSGGTGGNAGDVTVINGADVITHGANSSAIYAESVGGGGGDGGNSVGAGALGSSGGAGGYGGKVSVVNTGSLSTDGKASKGIYAQSLGGGGGNGGDSGGIASLGGDGSGTTNGDTVDVVNSGQLIQTKGADASGIFAQSIGGGGGNGGGSVGVFTSGGSGGDGGDSAAVTVTNSGDIDAGTIGAQSTNSQGIFAQSIGGGGGNGGGAISAGVGVAAAFGGSGGGGGQAGQVHVKLDNIDPNLATGYDITTHGDQSSGLVAQSIGGGGGNGGFAVAASVGSVRSFSYAQGGSGGKAGDADSVDVAAKGSITTLGADSYGVIAQSVGGGGGNGGFAVAATAAGSGAALSMGGDGGSGGAAKSVTVSSYSDISTAGSNSAGIFAQSIGGGGGNGGFSVAGAVGVGALSAALGGVGGAGDAADFVTVTSRGAISTAGNNSDGIQAQSIGGGGGNGGFSVAAALGAAGAASLSIGGKGGTGFAGGDVSVTAGGAGQFVEVDPNLGVGTDWSLVTQGQNAIGVFAQSVGGGGGNGGFSGSLAVGGVASVGVALGGKGAAGADGKTVTVFNGDETYADNILTLGSGSTGILAQSVGGGGGNGGFAVALSGSGSLGPVGVAGAVALGGSGGSAGNADQVKVDSIGKIDTFGDLADGIIAQSVGGGGGNGGFAIAGALSGGIGASVTIGGLGSTGGDARWAHLTSTGDITTHGAQSVGLFSQSVGGGGGNGGFAISAAGGSIAGAALALGGGGGNGGKADEATISSTGAVTTFGSLAPALMAQSVGGSGGNGGFSASLAAGQYAAPSLAFGGSGGTGATAGRAAVDSTGDIDTEGDQAFGVIAQSVGGGGGNGGFAASGSVTTGGSSVALAIAMGGDGGSGGSAGAAHLGSTGDVLTFGAGSVGLFAQSLGGGGGNGGFSGALAISNDMAYDASIGGKGGDGNFAGAVDVTSTGWISTSGDNAHGIEAQSIGGGGGNGGFSLSLDAANKGDSIGGKLHKPPGPDPGVGGSGGYAGSVTVNTFGTVATQGALANAIFAQSVGGGGGNGGFAVGASLAIKGDADMNAVGGAGGSGNYAADVTVITDATVPQAIQGYSAATLGDGANGILAQSIGGGGGNGGFVVSGSFSAEGSAANNTVGGSGGTGDYAGKVTVQNLGSIITYGANANGIFAQSVGGGGGNGGFSASVAATAKDADASAQSVGGSGGVGGYANDVKVTSTGDVQTTGDLSHAIFAQSVGGGGGDGGFSVAGSLAIHGGAETNSTGGSGGSGDHAGDVTVDVFGAIQTHGAGSSAILAQSIGGGGGTGGFAGGLSLSDGDASATTGGGMGGAGEDGRGVNVTTGGVIETFGAKAVGILAQSVGGGGGEGGFAITATGSKSGKSSSDALGGAGGDGGVGGAVVVGNTASVITHGALSHGILAQSVGGGGGDGGFAVAGGFSLSEGEGAGVTSSATGGKGGGGHDAGTVDVTNSGLIATTGAATYGILAQSIGGGGGSGGFAGDIAISRDGEAVSASIGGSGGDAGAGMAVTVNNTGVISVSGDRATGLFAQSVGGGGGVGGFSLGASAGQAASAVNQAVGGSGGGGGSAGDVWVDNDHRGTITTSGAMAYGLLAQSVGGGGGSGGFAISAALTLQNDSSSEVGGGATATGGSGGTAGAGGKVTVINAAAIGTDGAGATGLFAQSVGGGGGAGGFAGALALDAGGSATVANAVGGGAGAGGKAGEVDVAESGVIQTLQANSIGLLAQSVGGGGGQGGFALGLGVSKADATTSSIGGSGGAAGDSDHVDVLVNAGGLIVTEGDLSYGVLAQSVGGGGGAGGFAVGGSLSLEGQSQSTVGGGAGGTAGKAGDVKVTLHGDIYTYGADSGGVLAQSVGGGGGAGGFSVSAGVSAKGGAASNSVGGAGAGGGDGNSVNLINDGGIYTAGARAFGILAQSVGGGGGSGAFALGAGASEADAVDDTTGGAGGAAGAGGNVSVHNLSTGVVHTLGAMANGVQAQSVGGGGGAGGFVVDGAVSLKGDAKASVGGGAGGGGGSAGDVQVVNDGAVLTEGADAVAVFAQSVGGGGGSGGFAGGLSVANGASLTSAVGGAGALGGSSGAVSVVNSGQIRTLSASSVGVLAQSIGGGGGRGGMAISGSGSSGHSTSNSVGGSGAGGGAGGAVSVSNSGLIETDAALSYGVFAQSVGGGGGSGGLSVAGTLSNGGGGVTGSIGGSGAGGGDGGTVTVVNTGSIIAKGAGSTAVLAQSVGGGGGAGGFSGALRISGGGSLDNTVGGFGGTGGSGGDVSVTSTGTIATLGDDSIGVLAQSIGGGGGASAMAISAQVGSFETASLGLGGGGSGHGGGHGKVTVDVTGGQIITGGALSYGVLIQSVAGGGGVAAISVPDPLTVGPGGIALTLGSTGAIIGDGSDVAVTNANPAFSTGAGSVGLIAQSVGGGGGIEGVTGDVDIIGGLISAALGGDGGGGGSGGAVALSNSGQVSTGGDNAFGVLAQSIGGGGGDGSYSVGVVTGTASGVSLRAGGAQAQEGDGKALSFTAFSGAVYTSGALATGVLLQSIGGGGGVTNFVAPAGLAVGSGGVTLQAGGASGAGGAGGAIALTTKGVIGTTGVGAAGLLAQSIGGGGGQVGFDAGGVHAPAITAASLGGKGSGGAGGAVAIDAKAAISTTGAGSAGLLGQSIGGGGGTLFASGAMPGAILLGGGSGAGGALQVVADAAISTSGVASPGVLVQSIGGGGGYAAALSKVGAPLQFTANAASAGSGAGGAADVTINGAVMTIGAASDGLIVQSIGGGGGIAGAGDYAPTLGVSQAFAGTAGGHGAGGAITVAVNADVRASGADSSAIFLQSAGGSGGGPILLNVAATSMVIGGTGLGAGVRLLDGGANSLVNHGIIASMGVIDGWSVRAGNGADAVDNSGDLYGSIDLGAGADSLRNRAGANIYSGLVMSLGAGEQVLNEGVISPGGQGRVLTTALTGDFVQTSTGALKIDLDFARTGKSGEADRLSVSGAADVTGQVRVSVYNKQNILPGDHAVTILSAGGGATHSGLGLVAPVSAIAGFDLAYPDLSTIQLAYHVDFSPPGLNRNQTSVGDHFNALQTAGSTPAMAPVIQALFDIASTAALIDVYDRLSQEPYVQQLEATHEASLAFSDRLFSCSAHGGEGQVRSGDTCIWVRFDLGDLTRDKTSQQLSFHEGSSSLSGGFETGLGAGWRLGLALDYDKATATTGSLIAHSSGDRAQAGAVVKKDAGWAELALAVTGGKADFDTTRHVAFPGPAAAEAQGRQRLSFGAVKLRAAHTYESAATWVRPAVEVVGTRVHSDALSESGAGPLNLKVDARNQDYWQVRPSVEAGHDFKIGQDLWLRATVKAGVNQIIAGRASALDASFEAIPAGVGPFVIHSAADSTTGEGGASLALVNARGASVRIGFNGQFGRTTHEEMGQIKAVLPF